MPDAPRICSTAYAQHMIAQSAMLLGTGRALNLGIFRRDNEVVMGEVTLDLALREIGIWLGAQYWRQHYGSEALRAALEFAHHGFGLEKLSAMVHRSNLASCRLFEKTGFVFRELAFRPASSGCVPYLTYRLDLVGRVPG